jgi:hypothetical protein
MSLSQAGKLACLITVGVFLVPASPSFAQMTSVVDVALGEGGVLRGSVVDHHEVPQPSSNVIVYRDGQMVAGAKSNDKGEFCISGLAGGVYMVACGPSAQMIRAWIWKTAPPAAKPDLKVTSQSLVVRGQTITPWQHAYDFIEAHPFLGYGMIATAIAVPIAVIAHNQDKGDAS